MSTPDEIATDVRRLYDDYVASIPRFDRWERQECLGYFGYGSGRAAPLMREIVERTGQEQPLACNSCRLAQECWDRTKAKAHEVLPETSARFAELAEIHSGAALLDAWQREHAARSVPDVGFKPEKVGTILDPYSALMVTNMQRGAVHQIGENDERRKTNVD